MSIKSTQLLAKNTMECAFVWFIQCGKFPWQEICFPLHYICLDYPSDCLPASTNLL